MAERCVINNNNVFMLLLDEENEKDFIFVHLEVVKLPADEMQMCYIYIVSIFGILYRIEFLHTS